YPLNDNGSLTSAYRMYQLACLNDSPLSSCNTPLIYPSTVAAGDAASVRWGNRPGKVVYPEFSKAVCADNSDSLLEVGRQLVFGFIEGLVSYDDKEDPVNAQCAYHSVIYADELVYVDKAGTVQQKQRLAEALKNKVVMYGLSLEGLHDNIDSPVHGLLPGVFFHAMALDNLMHYGADYVHASDDRIERINQYIWIVMTLLFSFILFYYERRGISFGDSDDSDTNTDSESRLSVWWLAGTATLSIVLISAWMFLVLRYEPLNSLGFLVLIGVSSGLVHSNFAEWLLEKLVLPWRYARVWRRKLRNL
ncbi:MAG: CHASE2 domain-containing protein, partial [Gammaproteobacteria bacterium]|nr:CHASE2 domain-containing protein [Gammaproteobacteria bacterium]